MTDSYRTFYICDRKRKMCEGKCNPECHHTLNSKHAVNGRCTAPQKHRERFKMIKSPDGIEFWERLDYKKEETDGHAKGSM